jgi:hypothetical protein
VIIIERIPRLASNFEGVKYVIPSGFKKSYTPTAIKISALRALAQTNDNNILPNIYEVYKQSISSQQH